MILEVALLPFRFIPALHIVAWEAEVHVLRIGPVLPLRRSLRQSLIRCSGSSRAIAYT